MKTVTGFPLYLLNQVSISTEIETGKLYRSLRKDLQELEKSAKMWLASNEDAPFLTVAEKHLEQLFTARIKALKWFAEHKSQIEYLYDSMERSINRSYDFDKENLIHLHENARFALRTARRIIEGASSQIAGGFNLDQMGQDLTLEKFSYKQFQTMVMLILGESPVLNTYLHFLRQGLLLDFALMTALEIMDRPNQYKDSKIHDLSWFIVDAAQEVGASAVQLGIVKGKVASEQIKLNKLSEEDVKREQQLAEAGFEDWAKNLE